MKLTDQEYDFLYKKLEYKFKNSGHELVDKIKEHEDLSDGDIKLLLKKLEYTFRKSNNDIIKKLSNLVDLEDVSVVKYSNLKQHQKQIEKEKLKNLKSFDDFDG